MKEQSLGTQGVKKRGVSDKALRFARTAGLALLGVLLSQATVFENLAPFGVAFAAAVPFPSGLVVAMGTALGYLLPGAGFTAMRYVAALFAVTSIRWALAGAGKVSRHPAFAPVVAFLATLLTGSIPLVVQGITLNAAVTGVAEALLAGGAAYFFHISVGLLYSPRSASSLSRQELCSLVISIGAALVGLTGIDYMGVSPGRIVAVALVLCAARYGHEAAGAIAGVAAGLIMGLSGAGMQHLGTAYAFGGLMGGVFAPMGKLATALSFLLANGIVAVAVGGSPGVYAGIYEALVGALVFVLIPKSLGADLSKALNPKSDVPSAEGLRRAIVMRLGFASRALGEISQAVGVVTDKLRKISAPNISSVYQHASDDVCKDCGLRMFCWGPAYNDTQSALNDMTDALREKGTITLDDAPSQFKRRCCRPEDMVKEINHSYQNFSIREGAERRAAEIRAVMADQFEGMSRMLSELTEEFEEAECYDTEAASRVREALEQNGLLPLEVSCVVDRYRRMEVTASVAGHTGIRVNKAELTDDVSHACDRDFSHPTVDWAGDEARLIFKERAALSIRVGEAQHASGDAPLCGDSYETFSDGRGHEVLVISDGMGRGGRAAVEGAMASGLLERLVCAGFGYDNALNIVNSALLVKSADEALATLDVASLDLYTGKLIVRKAGAPITLLRRNGRVLKCDTVSLPVGILRDVRFEQSEYKVAPGDVVLMMSDGVDTDEIGWIEDELLGFDGEDAQEFADHLLQLALERAGDHEDDMTILVGAVRKGA